MRKKTFTKVLTAEDRLDITLHWESGNIIKFALNYRTISGGQWKEVYRVDNFHGFLHEQIFWRNPKPILLTAEELMPIDIIVDKYIEEITQNFQKYKEYFKKSKERK